MKQSTLLLAVFAHLQAIASGSPVPAYFRTTPFTPRDLQSSQVQHDLGSQLSNSTTFYGPGSVNYTEGTERWNVFAVPKVQVIIEPGQESDISTIIKYCNKNSVEFLAYNRGHGFPKSLGTFNGVQINLANLRNITISPDNNTAWLQGGAFDGETTRYLWDKGFVATTGACDCVGLMGAGLGGGHGRLEGLYGMVSDNIVQLNVVLANGSSIRVNQTSHSNLLWGMKGAGHNFGIVTSFELKIHPRGPDTWHYRTYIWMGDKLEAVFTALNNLQGNGTTPVNMAVNFGNFFINSSITTSEPVIWWTFAYRGTAAEASPYFSAFDNIGSVYNETADIPYPEVAHAQQTGESDAICQPGTVRITTTAGLQVYNITAEQQIWDSFTKRISESPDVANAGIILHEGYSTEAVEAQNPADSAYPFRDDHHLMFFQGVIAANSSSELESALWEWAGEVRDYWNQGQPGRLPDAYVNYANGFETVEEWYGHEAWRISKLRGLKQVYDPDNRFRFYNPIVSGSTA